MIRALPRRLAQLVALGLFVEAAWFLGYLTGAALAAAGSALTLN